MNAIEQHGLFMQNIHRKQAPSFSIYEPGTTEKVKSLIHCFLQEAEIDVGNLQHYILAKDGLVYTACYDSRMPWHATERVKVIISFQKHTYGRFAVIRLKRNNQEKF